MILKNCSQTRSGDGILWFSGYVVGSTNKLLHNVSSTPPTAETALNTPAHQTSPFIPLNTQQPEFYYGNTLRRRGDHKPATKRRRPNCCHC